MSVASFELPIFWKRIDVWNRRRTDKPRRLNWPTLLRLLLPTYSYSELKSKRRPPLNISSCTPQVVVPQSMMCCAFCAETCGEKWGYPAMSKNGIVFRFSEDK